MKLQLDIDAFTFGDLEDFEKETGESLVATFSALQTDDDGNLDLSGLSMSTLVSLVWIMGRTQNPEFTREDARKVRLDELEVTDAEPDPTPGSGATTS